MNMFKIETATQTNDTGTFYPIYRDIYINSTLFKADTNKLGVIYNADNATNKANENAILNHVDTSSSLEAYNFFNSYLDYARQNELGTNLCSLLQSDEMKNLVTTYQVLSSDAQKIVYSSSDYQRYGAIKDNWYSTEVTLMNLGENLEYIARGQNNSTPVFGNGLFGNNSSSIDTSLFIVIAASSSPSSAEPLSSPDIVLTPNIYSTNTIIDVIETVNISKLSTFNIFKATATYIATVTHAV